MVGFVAGIWGLFGGFAIAGLDLKSSLQRRKCWPWQADEGSTDPEISAAAYFTGEIIRMILGAGLAWAAAATGQVSGPLGAVGIGAAAPLILDQISRSALGNSKATLPTGHAADKVPADEHAGIAKPEPVVRAETQGQE
jgi:hypothetical protein